MSLLPVTPEGRALTVDRGHRQSLYDHLSRGMATELPEPIRSMHFSPWSTRASGVFRVDQSSTVLAGVLGRVVRLPQPAEQVTVTLRIERIDGNETWHRQFGSRTLTSSQWERQGLLFERFGPVSLALELQTDHRRLRFTQRAGYLTIGSWYVRLPASVAPQIQATVSSDGPELHIDVSVRIGWAGVLLHYTGWLVESLER